MPWIRRKSGLTKHTLTRDPVDTHTHTHTHTHTLLFLQAWSMTSTKALKHEDHCLGSQGSSVALWTCIPASDDQQWEHNSLKQLVHKSVLNNNYVTNCTTAQNEILSLYGIDIVQMVTMYFSVFYLHPPTATGGVVCVWRVKGPSYSSRLVTRHEPLSCGLLP